MEGLDAYVDLLNTWQAKMNLVAESTLAEVWTRHIADSLVLADLMPAFELNVDLGSGGGLPGIVLAIARRNQGGRVDLVESNQKKAAFLRAAQRTLGLSGTVHAARIEECGAVLGAADTITARALAALPDLLALVAPHIRADTRCFFHKGRLHEEEMALASAQYRFGVVQHEGDGGDGSTILEIADIAVA
ncbi:16S rRNA (guanine(527)-N(7))-methyltransferase RsmG [Aurantimonas sp. Leaf443]|uniref:16S rRNA (guanine(527)-N(7))-methyltransferase RsmG n=1 Tax=Aurantimonas sp. Leaf443 TaxID=1736378 RepID=UPI001FCD6834|nr:16S rRNA (guanine(527)-N(7))-methyltransferase RsmG [Aurantimonas sp. Leaf443]